MLSCLVPSSLVQLQREAQGLLAALSCQAQELPGADNLEWLLAGCHPYLDIISNDHWDASIQHRQLQAHTPPCPSGSQAEVCLLHVILITWIHVGHISVDDQKACTAVQLESQRACKRSGSRSASCAGVQALQGQAELLQSPGWSRSMCHTAARTPCEYDKSCSCNRHEGRWCNKTRPNCSQDNEQPAGITGMTALPHLYATSKKQQNRAIGGLQRITTTIAQAEGHTKLILKNKASQSQDDTMPTCSLA